MTTHIDSDVRFSRLPVPDRAALPPKLRAQFDALEKQLGYLPNWASSWGLGGENTVRLIEYLLPLLDPSRGELSYADRELLATVTSAENGCSYCRLNHTKSLTEALGDKILATRIGLDYREVPELTDKQRALAEFASKVALHTHEVTDADYQRLQELDYTPAQIFEALLVITVFAAANRLTVALNVIPDRQFFE